MFEKNRSQEASPIDAQGWEERFSALPESTRADLMHSWETMEELIQRFERAASEETLNRVEKITPRDEASAKAQAGEIHEFFGKVFLPEENMDPMQQEIALTQGIVDTYVVRENGEIISALQAQLLHLPTRKGMTPEAMFAVWYVETNPEYVGKPVTRELVIQSMRGSLAHAKENMIKMKGIIGETEPEVEKLFNRYGVERLYYTDKKGNIVEMPYLAPPEDEVSEGAPAHIALRLFDDRRQMPWNEFMGVIDTIYSQYTRPEFFTPEYLKFAEEYYTHLSDEQRQEVSTPNITPAKAERYRQRYMKKAEKIKERLQNESKKSVDGQLFFMSERERRARREQGDTIIDWEEKE